MGKLSDGTKIGIAIVIAGILIAVAIYARPIAGRYAFSSPGNQIRTVDTTTGEAISCAGDVCVKVEKQGERLVVKGR